jgi:hypothetical protein
MKKTLFAILIGLTLAGFIVAQPNQEPNPGRLAPQNRESNQEPAQGTPAPQSQELNQSMPAQTVTAAGTLQLLNGMIAIVNSGEAYYVPNLEGLTRFIDGLKEGTEVTAEGYAYKNNAYTFLRLSKLTVNGKSYNFPATPPPQTVTAAGTLQLLNGMIAIVNSGEAYYVPNLEGLTRFIDGLKEGTEVTAEGYAYKNNAYTFLRLSKLTVNGKSYNFPVQPLQKAGRDNFRPGRRLMPSPPPFPAGDNR